MRLKFHGDSAVGYSADLSFDVPDDVLVEEIEVL